jgi:hypothetical protein
MTKYEIMAMIMHNQAQFDADPFTVTAKLAVCLERISELIADEDLAELIQIGAAIYRFGAEKYKREIPLEELLPACENWPVPIPRRQGNRRGNQ